MLTLFFARAREAACDGTRRDQQENATGNQSGVGETSAQTTPRHRRQVILEGSPSGALRFGPESFHWLIASAESRRTSGLAMDSAHAERFLRGGAAPQLRDAPETQKVCAPR